MGLLQLHCPIPCRGLELHFFPRQLPLKMVITSPFWRDIHVTICHIVGDIPDVHDMSQVLIAELRNPELLNPHLGCPVPHNINIFDSRTQGFVIAFSPITLPELVEAIKQPFFHQNLRFSSPKSRRIFHCPPRLQVGGGLVCARERCSAAAADAAAGSDPWV